MRTSIWLSALIVLFTLAGCNKAPAEFSPPGGNFKVSMPGKPTEKTQDHGNSAATTHLYASESGGMGYIVGYTESANFTAGIATDKLLDAARDGALQSSSFKLLSEQRITVDGNPGRDLSMRNGQGYTMRLKLAVAGDRLYQVGVAAKNDEASSPKIETYVQSFHITGK